ncbi:HpcH/HpaI aldolase/citrate lyase family protein [Chloroflexota bacterium]
MKKNKIKESVRQGRIPVGVWVDIDDPHVVEMMGIIGFDFVVLEYEHCSRTLSELERLIYAADVADITPLVRLRELDTPLITKILAAGAMGIILAQTQTKEHAAKLVESVKYPPLGHRGAHPTIRAAKYSTDFATDFAEWCKLANRETMTACIIEDHVGIENVEEIAAVEGIDIIHYGPVDLALEVGLMHLSNWSQHPKMVAMRDKVYKAAKDHKKLSVGSVFNLSETAGVMKLGADIVVFVHDITQLRLQFESALKTIRETTEGAK